ncbi:MAG: hypothetical protein K2X81_08255 [Candidatus Obscuribacterales bacterium]|nr:hypothetical protein [Candidatus Obscuribacterales bacterium]
MRNRFQIPADRHKRKAKPITPDAILLTGRKTSEARPPAIWFKASRMTTISRDLPVEAIDEILDYYENNKALLEMEAAEESPSLITLADGNKIQ